MPNAQSQDLIEQFLPLVRPIAKRLHSRIPASFLLEDLVATGYLALVEACTRKRCANRWQFQCYLRQRIRGAMLDSLRGSAWRECRAPKVEDVPEPADPVSPERLALEAELRREVAKLPGMERTVLELEVAGVRMAESARILNLHRSTVLYHKRRALRRLSAAIAA